MGSSNIVENKLFDKTFLDKEYNQHLSLQVSSSQFKAAWFDIPSKTYIGLQNMDINAEFNWETVYSSLFPLGKSYQSLSLSLVNNNYTLVPKGIFDEQNIDSYLRFNLGKIEGEFAYDTIDSVGAHLVYSDNNQLVNEIKSSLPGIKVGHFGKSLLEAFSQEKGEEPSHLFIHVQSERFDLACYKQKQLIFFNSFTYKTAEDFIYFLLYVMEQLKLDRESCSLSLSGEILEQSSIYDLLYKYIRNICWLDRPKSANYSSILNQIPSHFHYSLYNQYLCE